MAVIQALYGAAQTMVVTALGALASAASPFVAGWASDAVDNGPGTLGPTVSDEALDVFVGGKITTSGTPTANTQIEIWAYGSYDGTTYTAGISGTQGAATLTQSEKPMLYMVQTIPNIDTTARTYEWGPVSLASVFGGNIPRKWGIWIVHNTGAALAAAASQELKFTTLKYESV